MRNDEKIRGGKTSKQKNLIPKSKQNLVWRVEGGGLSFIVAVVTTEGELLFLFQPWFLACFRVIEWDASDWERLGDWERNEGWGWRTEWLSEMWGWERERDSLWEGEGWGRVWERVLMRETWGWENDFVSGDWEENASEDNERFFLRYCTSHFLFYPFYLNETNDLNHKKYV